MENSDDKPLSLRGPSLPGSLGVRVRGDWESFGEVHEGIQMRGSDGNDANVQLDLMKEENNPKRDRESMGEKNEGMDLRGIKGEDSIAQFDSMNEGVRISREKDIDETGRKFPLYMQTTKIGQPNKQSGLTDGQSSQGQSQYEGHITPSTHSCHLDDGYGGCNGLQAFIHKTQDVQPTLSLNDDAAETGSSFWEGTTESESSHPVHPLPCGKKYHVFFSYDMADRGWVHSVAEKLESEYGYRCSFHERDFHGGKRVIENIMEHIQWSVKTVLVLSPDFLERSWCQFEMKQGLHASIEEARMLIVPVMLRECEVPDTLRSLTYIDATPGKDWWGRFMEAVAAEDHLQICNADKNQMSIQPKYENFELLCEVSSVFRCCFGEKFFVPYTPEMLKKPGIEVPDAEFHIATSLVKEAQHTNCLNKCLYDYIPIYGTFTTILSVLLITCVFASAIAYLIQINDGQLDAATKLEYRVKGSFLIITPLFGLATYIAVFVLQIKKRKAAIRKATINMNRVLL